MLYWGVLITFALALLFPLVFCGPDSLRSTVEVLACGWI
jgi:hypothetical protein